VEEVESQLGAYKRRRLPSLGPDKPERDAMLQPFGDNLRSLRSAAGFSQDTLARRSFLSGHDISDLERGRSVPLLPALLMLGDALGVPADALTDGLAAPTRRAGRTQALALLTSHPGIRIQAIAEAMEVPPWYAFQLVRYLQVTGAIVWRSGWQAKQSSTTLR